MRKILIRVDKYFRITLAFPFGFIGLILILIAKFISPEAISMDLNKKGNR